VRTAAATKLSKMAYFTWRQEKTSRDQMDFGEKEHDSGNLERQDHSPDGRRYMSNVSSTRGMKRIARELNVARNAIMEERRT
jgi:hypothetical protein